MHRCVQTHSYLNVLYDVTNDCWYARVKQLVVTVLFNNFDWIFKSEQLWRITK